jgi:folate-binding Fe-S cluster repair protein YgfZ
MNYSWIPAGAVRVTGSDRIPFVHGQSTNDVRGLPTPGAQRTLILNAKGQIEFDVRVFKRQDDLYLQTAPGMGSAVLERLKRYVVFDDVQLGDITTKILVVHLSGQTILEFAAKLGFDPTGANVQQFSSEIAGTLLAVKIDRGVGVGLDIHTLTTRIDRAHRSPPSTNPGRNSRRTCRSFSRNAAARNRTRVCRFVQKRLLHRPRNHGEARGSRTHQP